MSQVVGTAIRAATGFATFGGSELLQKKPFTYDTKQTISGGLAGRIGEGVQGAIYPDLTPPSSPRAPTTETKAVQQAAAEAAQRRSKARGFRSTILSKDFMASDAPALQQTLGS